MGSMHSVPTSAAQDQANETERMRTWEARNGTMMAARALLLRNGDPRNSAALLRYLNLEVQANPPATPEAYLRHPHIRDNLRVMGVDIEEILARDATRVTHPVPPPSPTAQ
jgi:hypothetical protein